MINITLDLCYSTFYSNFPLVLNILVGYFPKYLLGCQQKPLLLVCFLPDEIKQQNLAVRFKFKQINVPCLLRAKTLRADLTPILGNIRSLNRALPSARQKSRIRLLLK